MILTGNIHYRNDACLVFIKTNIKCLTYPKMDRLFISMLFLDYPTYIFSVLTQSSFINKMFWDIVT